MSNSTRSSTATDKIPSMLRWFFVAVLLCSVSACQKKDAEERSLTPQESLRAMKLSDDFHVELFAAEPEVMSPVEVAFDEAGRVWVAEMLDYPDDPPAGKPARSRIRLLQTDSTGKVVKATIFAEQLLAVSGLMPWDGGVIVPCAPDILFLKDTNGDGKADLRKVLYTGFAKSNHETRITNPRLGIDNWIYLSNSGNNGLITSPEHPEMKPLLVRGGDFRFDPVSGRAEVASGPAQFGSTLDEFGARYISQNTTHIRQVVLPMEYLARSPLLEVKATAQDISDHGRPSGRMYPLTGPQEWRKARTALRQQRYNENKLKITEQVGGWFTAASGGTLYNGDAFPSEYEGNVFTGDVSGNLIHRDVLKPDGATFAASRAKDGVEFLASTDVWFRPCNFANAPDGNLYFTDIYRQVIETPESIPEEIRRKINFYNGDTMGRVYRIVPNRARTDRSPRNDLTHASIETLVHLFEHTNGWHRVTAQRLLLQRHDLSVVPSLRAMTHSAKVEGRVHALWMLQAYNALTPEDVRLALSDTDARVRRNALQLSEKLSGGATLQAAVLKSTADVDPQVQFQSALTLGSLPSAQSMAALQELAHARSSDAWFRLAILSSVANSASSFYDAATAKGNGWIASEMQVELSALIGARKNAGELARWFGNLPKVEYPDRVLAGLSRGLQLSSAMHLQVPGAENRLAEVLARGDEPARLAAWEVTRHLEAPKLMALARESAQDQNAEEKRRIAAIGALRGDRFLTVQPVMETLLRSHSSAAIESAVVESLASFREPAAANAILANFRSYRPETRQKAVDAMLSQRDRVPLLLTAVEEGRIDKAALGPDARAHLFDDRDASIAKRSRDLFADSTSDRTQVVASYKEALNINGDVAHGKQLFETHCAKCHFQRRAGARVGPDLSGINNKTKDELLVSILNPSYAIEPRFVNYVLTTVDGRILNGIIANETPGGVTIRGASAEGDETILRKDVADIRASSVSLMPEGFEKDLTKKDIADLIAYLRGGL